MFSRALLIALCIVYVASSLTPLSAPADDDCALYLTGPGRSSAYDYSLNLLKGNFAYDGQHTCITYDAINQAYIDARTRILVSQPKGDWKAEDFASVGELILDISISLARTYGLTYEEIEKGLPLIDTSRTLIREVCPPVFSHVECRAGKYRRLDGLCNNLRHPTWGATMAPFQRLIGPLFADGINAPRISHTGRDLPLSRVVSRTMHPDEGFHDHAGTVMVIAWGQFMDHDYTLTGTPLDPIHRNDPEECCKRPPHLKHPYCNEIRVPDDDYFYRLFGVKCIDFVRGFPSPRPGCRLGSRVPFNTLTGAIDGNTVYGVTEKFARKLRTGYGGLLRMNPVFKEYGLKDLLPLKLDIPDEGCTRPNKNMYCFEAGEIRVNEQLVLTVMHTLMAREHNRVAKELAAVNPHWDDETLFQEARRINIAEIQHITYNEFLPILLGKDVMEKFGLVLEKEGYWDGYDQEVNPDVIASFASAAYRFGHSLLPTAVERWSKAHKFIASKRLSDLIRRPYDLYRAGVLDEYVMGLMNQVAQAMDDSITQEVTNHLFKKVGARFGMDLVSFNMQRGREFGIPGYMEFRKFCGLSGADSFQDLFGSMANETIQRYESIFEHPIDVDLWSGGVSERPLAGSMLGPTFACIIATQFSYSRRGDRFWFELPNQPSSFTPEQLAEIRKSRLARVICDNTDIIDTVQLYPMVLPDHELNPRVPCRSGIIPSMDFSKWAEPVPFIGGAKEYMTDAYLYDKITTNGSSNTSEPNINIGKLDLIKNEDNKTVNIIPQFNDTKKHNSNLLTINVSTPPDTLGNSIINTGINCINETSQELHSQQINELENNDKIIKYVYKIKESPIAPEKNKGHFRNALKRKKRSENTENKIISSELFEHDDKNQEELTLPDFSPDAIVKIANLADFNIQTLHNIKPINIISLQDNHKQTRKNHYLPTGFRKHNENLESNDGPISNENEESKEEEEVENEESKEEEEENEESKEEEEENEKGFYTRVEGDIVPLENSESIEDNIYTPIIRNSPKHITFNYNDSFQKKQKENKGEESDSDEESKKEDILTLQKQDIKIGDIHLNKKTKDYYGNQKTSLELDNNNDYKDNDEHNSQQIRNNKYDDSEEEKIIGKINLDNDSKERETYLKNSDEEDTVQLQDKENHNENIEYTRRSTGGKPEYNEFNSNNRYYDLEDEDINNRKALNNKGKEFYPIESREDIDDRGHPRKLENSDNNMFKSNDKYRDNKKEKIINERILADESDNNENNYDSTVTQRNTEESQDNIDYTVIPITQKGPNYNNKNSNNENLFNPRKSNERKRGNFQKHSEEITINPSDLFTNDKDGREEEIINKTNGHILEINNSDDKSTENSKERNNERENSLSNKYKTYDSTNYTNDSGVIQDIDLDDFGHERIQLNNIGQVEPDKDLLENFDDDSSGKGPNDREEYPVNINKHYNLNDDEKQIKINDGEVRPVVELNDEDSGDSGDNEDIEDVSKERINAELKEEIEKNTHTHEEPSKEEVNEEFNKETVKNIPDKSIHLESLNGKKDVNVKQQFERIPVNYNHTAVQTNNSNDTNDENYNKLEGTLDSFLPKNKNYDENLNIKFTDVNIKLPEIKLPEDILSYAHDEPVNESDDDEYKDLHYPYVDSDKGAERYEQRPKEDKDSDDFYSSYLYKPHEEEPDKHENYDSDEDLYEKFVRERFGKNAPTINKSEKNLELNTNLELPKIVKNIYKKDKKTSERGKKEYPVAKEE